MKRETDNYTPVTTGLTAGQKVLGRNVCMNRSIGSNANTIRHCFNGSERLKNEAKQIIRLSLILTTE